ncbi:MAG: hypothetical protein M2R45_02959 [Verrucomicrobia subdivision 3 bacterium]|nr:hypothetical protein [Limisphaerales bacterium]MCS1415321.1 hypothetical protein [Limisphaerales bacterium]
MFAAPSPRASPTDTDAGRLPVPVCHKTLPSKSKAPKKINPPRCVLLGSAMHTAVDKKIAAAIPVQITYSKIASKPIPVTSDSEIASSQHRIAPNSRSALTVGPTAALTTKTTTKKQYHAFIENRTRRQR